MRNAECGMSNLVPTRITSVVTCLLEERDMGREVRMTLLLPGIVKERGSVDLRIAGLSGDAGLR